VGEIKCKILSALRSEPARSSPKGRGYRQGGLPHERLVNPEGERFTARR